MNAPSLLILVVFSLLAASPCPAEDAEDVSDALNLLLAHSDAVIVATSVKSETGPRFGFRVVSESFKDVVTLAGEPMDATLTIGFERSLLDDPTPFKPGQRFIIFLKRRHGTGAWELTDSLFGCQPYTQGLEGCVSAAAKSLAAKYH